MQSTVQIVSKDAAHGEKYVIPAGSCLFGYGGEHFISADPLEEEYLEPVLKDIVSFLRWERSLSRAERLVSSLLDEDGTKPDIEKKDVVSLVLGGKPMFSYLGKNGLKPIVISARDYGRHMLMNMYMMALKMGVNDLVTACSGFITQIVGSPSWVPKDVLTAPVKARPLSHWETLLVTAGPVDYWETFHGTSPPGTGLVPGKSVETKEQSRYLQEKINALDDQISITKIQIMEMSDSDPLLPVLLKRLKEDEEHLEEQLREEQLREVREKHV